MDADHDPFLENLRRELRRGRIDPSIDSRIMAAVRNARTTWWSRLMMRRRLFVSPVPWSLAATAALLMAGLVGARIGQRAAQLSGEEETEGVGEQVQFVLISPSAKKVSVVGDFNAWDRSLSAYQARHTGGGVWTLTAAVPAGHHRYSFVVDDSVWVADPSAPGATDHDFGVPKSALIVAEGKW